MINTIQRKTLRVFLFLSVVMVCFFSYAYADGNKGGGVIGTTFDLIGEILAFPFEIIAGAFRLIF